MVDIQLADVTIHIDQTLETERRSAIEDALRAVDGVISVHMPDDRQHLVVVEYNPEKTNSAEVLGTVGEQGVRAQLIGL